MNWGKIARYAAALFIAQFAIGFVASSFAPADAIAGIRSLFLSSAASFLVCGAIFARLAAGQSTKPFAHAWAAFIAQAAVGFLVWWLLARWADSALSFLVALEWLVLIGALLVGTWIGICLGRRQGQSADA